jgi:hypothetical protein
MNSTDYLLAKAQISLSHLMSGGFLAVIFVLIFFHRDLDDTSKTLLTGLAGVLGTIVTQQNGYWFQRQRPHTQTDGDSEVPTKPANPASTGVSPK